MKRIPHIMLILLLLYGCNNSEGTFETIATSPGDVRIRLLNHGSLYMQFKTKNIYIDPHSPAAKYSEMPKADLILITHHHRDHLDPAAIARIRTDRTKIVMSALCLQKIRSGIVLTNGETAAVFGIKITAVPAYNIRHMRSPGKPFHPKGEGNGYILTFGDKRFYIAGDTENTPEMKALKNIYVAFLPINLPYTMNAAMVRDAVRSFRPKILYPYHFHYGKTELPKLIRMMEKVRHTELRVRNRRSITKKKNREE